MQFGQPPRHRALPALEYRDGLAQFGNRLARARGVEHRDVSRITDYDAIVRQIHQPRRTRRDHLEAFGDPLRLPNLKRIRMQVGHANERAVPERGERIEDVVARQRTIAPLFDEQVRVDEPTPHIVVPLAPHQEQIGCRKDRDRDADIGKALCPILLLRRLHGGELRRVADRNAAAPFVFLGQLADEHGVKLLRRVPGVEMHVDVDIELTCQLEHAADLTGMIRVVVRRCAHRLRATLETFDHQLVGTWIVGEALLRHHAELDVDRPLVLVDQRLHALDPAHPDQRIDLDMRAHARGAVLDAPFQRLARAFVHILDRHGVLHVGHALHGVVVASLFRRAAIDDARLVEVDVGLDQPAAAQAPLGVVRRRIADEVRIRRPRCGPARSRCRPAYRRGHAHVRCGSRNQSFGYTQAAVAG